MRKTFKDHLFRCSSIGQLFINPRSKQEVLAKTTISYLDDIYKKEYFGRHKKVTSKYLEKGVLMEDEAIAMLSRIEETEYVKNKIRMMNDYISGEPDIITDDEIIDIKCSWDYTTFPLTETEIPTKNYYYQLQGYMELTGRKKARLIYCLMNTPQHLIDKELSIAFNEEEKQEVLDRMLYDDVPEQKRIKVFHIEYDKDVIEDLYSRIDKARQYLNTIKV